jgi:glycosyltransferase involved in cell wall biosynthesis
LKAFLTALPDFIRIMPDFRPKWVIRAIADRCAVAYPGCHFPDAPADIKQPSQSPPLIIWNHRWEHDKNPEAFFKALLQMHLQGIDFQVALLGEDYAQMPEVFKSASRQLGRRLVQYGRVASRRAYYEWLERGSVVVSTAKQENFGIAVVEAIYHGCLPLLPKKLSYPEILPEKFHPDFLYSTQDELERKLSALLTEGDRHQMKRLALSTAMQKYSWEKMIDLYDEELSNLVR